MKKLNPILVIGAIIDSLLFFYGGIEQAQKSPLGFMGFLCVGTIVPISILLGMIAYIT